MYLKNIAQGALDRCHRFHRFHVDVSGPPEPAFPEGFVFFSGRIPAKDLEAPFSSPRLDRLTGSGKGGPRSGLSQIAVQRHVLVFLKMAFSFTRFCSEVALFPGQPPLNYPCLDPPCIISVNLEKSRSTGHITPQKIFLRLYYDPT